MEYYTAIGIDVSDKTSKICVLTKVGGSRRIVEETTVPTTKEGFTRYLERKDRSWAVTFETGTHCRWMAKTIEALGFRVFVANPAKLRIISESNTKNDRNDARDLARITLADVELLHPVVVRAEPYQQMLRLLKAREGFLAIRTQLVNQQRGFAKSMGFRLPKCDAAKFHLLPKAGWPRDFEVLAFPARDLLETVNLKIKAYESLIRSLSETVEFKAMVDRCREVFGVGQMIACAFVAVIGGNPDKFRKARDIGPYLGLVPRQDQSGESEKQKRMTKTGSRLVRSLLMEGAKTAKKKGSKDTDLKLRGLRISSRGGKAARNKATAAVARGLAVAMLALLKHPEREYRPLSKASEAEFRLIREEEDRLNAKVMRKAS